MADLDSKIATIERMRVIRVDFIHNKNLIGKIRIREMLENRA